MDLSEYLDKKQMSLRELSGLCDVNICSIFTYKHKKRSPSLVTAFKIYSATGGNVSLLDLLSHEDFAELKDLVDRLTRPTPSPLIEELKILKDALGST